MPQTGPRFKGSDKAALYSAVIALTENEPKTAVELVEIVRPRFNPGPTVHGLLSMLRLWTTAGALVVAESVSPSKTKRTGVGTMVKYRSTPQAYSPAVIKAALRFDAGDMLAQAHQAQAEAERRRQALIASGRGERTEAVALVEDLPPEPMRTPIHEPEAKDPDRFFAATMGPDGVTITYDEYFRVVALLKRFSEGQVQ